jgi:glycerol-3-phosphate O-acyltransferase / dihydroxyacetone phosphate acyltransferase
MAFKVPPSLRDAVDRLVVWLARFVSKVWFRHVETEALDRISADRPVIVAANHSNGFVDPLVIVATSPRPLHFLAKGTLWKVMGLGAALDIAGVLPIHRREADDGESNDASFEACHRVLAADRAIGIFPEGSVNDATQLKPIKTGTARIALGARKAGARGLRIVPVGIVYGQKAKPRDRVLVRAGVPIDLDQVIPGMVAADADDGPGNHDLVHALTALLRERLADVALDYSSHNDSQRLTEAAAVYLRAPDADPGRSLALAGLEPIVRRLDRAPAEPRAAVLTAIDEYGGQLSVLSLDDGDVVPGNTPERLHARLSRSSGKVAALALPAAVGGVVNAVPFVAVSYIWRRPVARISKANNTILAGMVAFPLAWLGWGLLARRRGVRRPLLFVLATGPLCGQAAVACWEQLGKFRRGRLQWNRMAKAEDLMGQVREHRAAVVEAVHLALAAGEVGDATHA